MAGKKLSQAGKSQVTLKLSVPNCKKEIVKHLNLKLNYCKKVHISFCTQFLSLGIFINIKVEKTKTALYTTFNTDRIKLVLVFLISNLNKKSQGRQLSVV
jgi:hypothetical protein